MEPALARSRHEAIDDDVLVHEWRVDWHQVATLVRRGGPPRLALRIVR
jgi:hypothetical protein